MLLLLSLGLFMIAETMNKNSSKMENFWNYNSLHSQKL